MTTKDEMYKELSDLMDIDVARIKSKVKEDIIKDCVDLVREILSLSSRAEMLQDKLNDLVDGVS